MAIKELAYKDHDEWLAIRAKYIGGSDASAIIGKNPWSSPYTLWAEKTGKIPPVEEKLVMRVGAYLEEFVAQEFEARTGKKVRRKNRTLVNDEYPWACANLDRTIIGEKAFLECKTTGSLTVKKQVNGQEFPDIYYAQCLHYLAVTGYKKCYLAVLVENRDFYIFEMERDDEQIGALMLWEKEFWNCVQTNTPPPVDGSESTSDTLTTLYPESDGSTVDLFAYESEIEQYLSLKQQAKDLSQLAEEKANILKEVMKEASKGVCGPYKISFGTQTRRSLDTKRLIAENKTLDLTPYYTESIYRAFKVTGGKQ